MRIINKSFLVKCSSILLRTFSVSFHPFLTPWTNSLRNLEYCSSLLVLVLSCSASFIFSINVEMEPTANFKQSSKSSKQCFSNSFKHFHNSTNGLFVLTGPELSSKLINSISDLLPACSWLSSKMISISASGNRGTVNSGVFKAGGLLSVLPV
ncbi:hypothetical protein FOCC_FOCC016743 [Frankliniella occidentalis]|nr:hypothetical protein FOCC_FOCC016743 [Frankliniella occidentalis]